MRDRRETSSRVFSFAFFYFFFFVSFSLVRSFGAAIVRRAPIGAITLGVASIPSIPSIHSIPSIPSIHSILSQQVRPHCPVLF